MSRLKLLTAAAAATLLLSACVVAPYPRYAQQPPVAYGPVGEPMQAPIAVAEVPPPAPYAEVIPVIPFAGAVWIGGYWGWQGNRHVWIGGNWAAPRPGYVWNPHRWVPVAGGRWHLMGGGWARR